MEKYELRMPKMGESIIEATILNWVKNVGDKVELDDTIVEIATDKVDSEVPSPVEGEILELKYEVDDVVPVGEVIAVIGTEGEESASDSDSGDSAQAQDEKPEPAEKKEEEKATPAKTQKQEVTAGSDIAVEGQGGSSIPSNAEGQFFSPLVRNIAEQEGVGLDELLALEGSGARGRVTKSDILAYVKDRSIGKATQQTASPANQPATASTGRATQSTSAASGSVSSSNGNVEIVEMDRMRKLIAKHMVDSKQTSPHVTSFVEADMTRIVHWRNKIKKQFQEKHGEKITFTPIFIEAIVKAIRDLPAINISLDGDNILYKKDINIGMAAALPNGNLIVPVIHQADRLNLLGLTKTVNDLANRARQNNLKPEEIQGGTYTVTNVGTFGNVMGTPIINQPQVAIMATGAIRKVPAVVETPEGDFIGIRHKMFLSHSYDHRIVDGYLGGSFVKRVAEYLENFDIDQQIL